MFKLGNTNNKNARVGTSSEELVIIKENNIYSKKIGKKKILSSAGIIEVTRLVQIIIEERNIEPTKESGGRAIRIATWLSQDSALIVKRLVDRKLSLMNSSDSYFSTRTIKKSN